MGKYDYNSGVFQDEVRGGITFNLVIRTPITQITGESGTGKTFLVNHIKNVLASFRYNSDDGLNAIAFDSTNIDTLTIDKLKSVKGYLIVIDRCDLLLTDEKVIEFIKQDRNNHYLLFSRTALPLGLSPNYYGEFSLDGNTISIFYRFNEQGWF
jgi:predicted ATPase